MNSAVAVVFCVLIPASRGFSDWHHRAEADPNDGPLDCRPPYGCFPLGVPWLSPERPVSLPPLQLTAIRPGFRVFTPDNQRGLTVDEHNVTALIDRPLSPDLRVIFIAHGFIESGDTPWVKSMVKTLLKVHSTPGSTRSNRLNQPRGNPVAVAVVVVDWRDGAMPPYAQAVANIRLVGAVTGRLIILLQEILHLHGSSFHLVGHSLGSHLMGYAGHFVTRHSARRVSLGRITALDPAGPYFRNADPLVRLDPTDALFVDVLHTDSNEILPGIPVSLGNPDALGHVDFYPNGGGLQPGCSSSLGEEMVVYNKDLASGFLGFMGCHHQRSVHYFIESIASSCLFLAIECSSWEEYQHGRCWDCSKHFCSTMGFHSTPQGHNVNKTITNTAVITNSSLPYEDTNADSSTDLSVKVAIESFIAAVRETFDDVVKEFGNVEDVVLMDQVNESESSKDNISNVKALYNFLDQMSDLAQNLSRLRQKREMNTVVGKKMFLVTRNAYPFCGTQLRVTVLASRSADARRHGGDVAQFSLALRGTAATAYLSVPEHSAMFLAPGQSASVVTVTVNIGLVQELDVTFVQPEDLLHYLLLWRFETPVMHVDSFVVEDLVSGRMTIFPAGPQEFTLGETRSLRSAT